MTIGSIAMGIAMIMTAGTKKRKARILIAGLGNLLLQDDGVGVHAVRELQKDPPPGVLVAEVGTQVLGVLHLLEWADNVLALDAMQAGGAPGTIYAFGVDDVAEPEIQVSLHELGLRAALRMLPQPTQVEIAVLGVEPEVIDYGLELSPPVAAALPRLLRAARHMVRQWQERNE
jgi:hydrogenase maturation protease